MTQSFTPVDLELCAEVLDMLGRDIERLGEVLCSDPVVVANHMDMLQEIDRIAQYQRAVARVLHEGGHAGDVGIEALAARFVAAWQALP